MSSPSQTVREGPQRGRPSARVQWDTQLGVPTRQLTAMQGPDPDKPGCSWLRSAREPGWPVTW